MRKVKCRPAQQSDRAAIWSILKPVIRAGETYALRRDLSETDALSYWLGHDRHTFVAEDEGRIVGTYYLRQNQTGGGTHVANCGYVTATTASGRGIGRAMCEHSIAYAKQEGFRAIQFNFVISTNEHAVNLWLCLGFEIVGRLPSAFNHPDFGYVDALVMFRQL